MHQDSQRDGEIKERDTVMKTQTHTHRSGKRAERRSRSECRRNAAGPHQQLQNLCTEQFQGVSFSLRS